MLRKFLYSALAVALAFNLWLFVARWHHGSRGYRVHLASDTCSCPPQDAVLHLHVSKNGNLMVNSEEVQSKNLGALLSDIYYFRPERILYLSADSDVQFQNVAEIVDVVQNLQFHHLDPEPSALRAC